MKANMHRRGLVFLSRVLKRGRLMTIRPLRRDAVPLALRAHRLLEFGFERAEPLYRPLALCDQARSGGLAHEVFVVLAEKAVRQAVALHLGGTQAAQQVWVQPERLQCAQHVAEGLRELGIVDAVESLLPH